jgi:predicted amidohydrolase YtcJ
VVEEIGPRLDGPAVVDGAGGALLPGLHDHHVHLTALAAETASVRVGPEEVAGMEEMAAALHSGEPGGWVRAVGYHESVAGPLDRELLDRLAPDRPVRVQHRSGELWVWNGAALRAAGLPDAVGDGRFWREDTRLRGYAPASRLDLVGVGRRAAARGITGFTNADPDPAPDLPALLAVLPQQVTVLGLDADAPVKIRLDDLTLPTPPELATRMAGLRPRPVAVHCVTRVQLLVTLLALDEAGSVPGDRIEHGAVVPAELLQWIRELGVCVVTQPHFPVERAAAYARDVAPDDQACLYPCGTLAAAGVPLAAGTDAPYGTADPWEVMRMAAGRAGAESIPAQAALRMFLGHPLRPGGPPRSVEPGAPADLCLLHVPLHKALESLTADSVRSSYVAGTKI